MTNTTPTPEQWWQWATHDCSKALMRKILGIHMPKARTWFLIAEPDKLMRAQASFAATKDIVDYVSSCSKKSTRDICAEAGFEPDQLSE